MPIFLDFTGFFEGVYISCREKHGFTVLYYTFLTIVTRKALPQAQHVLHYEAHNSHTARNKSCDNPLEKC